MKILLTGGGSGGHFYPIIAIAQSINELAKENHLVEPKIFFVAPEPYNQGMLYNNKISFRKIPAGKLRRYFSLLNFLDIFKTFWGIIKSIWIVFTIYPDVVFGKGGYASFPPLFAAKLLRIPVIIHESDSTPGKVNLWAGKFARRVAVSYPEAAKYFHKDKVAFTGNPIRKEIIYPLKEGAYEFLKLKKDIPVILILGGSLGSKTINDVVVEILPKLVEKYQIIHQVGFNNFKEMKSLTEAVLYNNELKGRYKIFDYLNNQALSMAAGVSDLIISRGGSTIFEIANWEIPSIIIPITKSNGNHQRKNAFSFAKTGACIVIEESNLTDNILASEIGRILNDKKEWKVMKTAAGEFAKRGAARTIGNEILNIALEHEK